MGLAINFRYGGAIGTGLFVYSFLLDGFLTAVTYSAE